MSFEAREESRQLGTPANLYYFQFGEETTAFYAFTNSDRTITYDGIEYEPVAISNSEIQVGATPDKTSLEVELARGSAAAQRFIGFPPSTVVLLTIRQGHVDDPANEWPVVWIGRVMGSNIDAQSICRISCEPVSTSLKRVGPRRLWMRQCGLELYGDRCKASFGAASAVFTPASFTETTITMPDGWVTPEQALNYISGVVQWAGVTGLVIRTIVSISADKILYLNAPTTDLAGGEPVTVAYGCAHIIAIVDGVLTGDCKDLHNNIQNFGGDAWLPEENPVQAGTNNFY